MDRFITIAKVSGVHGIRGHLKIQPFTEPSSAFLDYKNFYWNYNKTWEPMPILKNSIKSNGQGFILNIVNCTDRDEARKYQFTEIAVLRSDFPELDPILNQDEYYWADLENLDVYSIYENNKKYLGKIDQIIATGSNDVLVVKDDKKEYLIPYLVGKYIVSIDLATRTMIVDWDPEF